MSLTPQVTLNISLFDYSGIQIGSTTRPAYVRIMLCGFGGVLPRVAATGMVGQVASWPGDLPYVGVPLAIILWGNDVITPAGTYYAISILDANRNVVQAANYQFTGNTSYDLSSLAPFSPPDPALTAQNPVLQNPPGAGTQTITGNVIINGSLSATGGINVPFGGKVTVAFNATPVFDATVAREFDMTLTGNVTGSSFTNAQIGPYFFKFIQDATGGRTFTWPANVRAGGLPDPTPAFTSIQAFWWNGTTLDASGPMISY